jgi:hypothetical protein
MVQEKKRCSDCSINAEVQYQSRLTIRFRPHSSLGYKPPAPKTKWLEKLNQEVEH